MHDIDQNVVRKRELIALYDTTATIYDKRYKGIQSEKYKYLVGHFGKKDFVLDVGCGTGLLICLLGGRVAYIVGVDLSREMLRVAFRNMRRTRIEGAVIRADADSLPFRSNIFSKIASVSLLQNMPDPRATISEVTRVLNTCGDVTITCLKKKFSLPELRGIIESGSPRLEILSEWDPNGEDVGVKATKPI